MLFWEGCRIYIIDGYRWVTQAWHPISICSGHGPTKYLFFSPLIFLLHGFLVSVFFPLKWCMHIKTPVPSAKHIVMKSEIRSGRAWNWQRSFRSWDKQCSSASCYKKAAFRLTHQEYFIHHPAILLKYQEGPLMCVWFSHSTLFCRPFVCLVK